MLKRVMSVCAIVTFCGAVLAQDAPEQQAPEQQAPEPQMPAQPMPEQMPEPMPEQPMEMEQSAAERIPDDLSTPRSALKILAQSMERGDAERIREVIHAETESEERMKEATVEMAEAVGQLRRAAISHWGPEGAKPLVGDVEGAMEQGMQRLAQAEESIEEDTAVVTAADAETPPVTLKRVDDKWRVPMSELHEDVTVEDLERPVQEMQAQAQVIRQFAAEVRQYQTAEEAAQALRSRMMQAAMSPEDEELRERPAAERQPPAEQPQEQEPQPMPLPEPQEQPQPQMPQD